MSDFRRRAGEAGRVCLIEDSDFGDEDHPRFPYIPVSLYIGTLQMAQRLGLKYLFTLTEPRLSAHFGKLGVDVHPIGPAVDQRRLWQPAVILVDEVRPNIRLAMRPLWRVIEDQITSAFERR
jgi:N-acyl amino acid synthase of PEP-CTERM/exosortase system